ncbi:MAG: hypothetical protein V4502_01685 [Pseudomonadota bacterium]
MTDGPEWFAPKRYGLGTSYPIAWQGWVVTIAYVAGVIAATTAFQDNKLIMAAIIIPLTVTFVVIVSRTTRGGWRWRWGDKD